MDGNGGCHHRVALFSGRVCGCHSSRGGGVVSHGLRARTRRAGWQPHKLSCPLWSGVPRGAPLLQSPSPTALTERRGHGLNHGAACSFLPLSRTGVVALWDRSLSFLWLPCVGSLSSHFSLHPISGSLPSQAASCSLLGCIAPVSSGPSAGLLVHPRKV